ncbi:phosphotriesterase family protein [Paludifilum halophilum]|uniref:Phosphotriesterase-related protein n=1 Tax=Paludifilum halophilum TaxID=1642702 RepID=A0A235B3G3_9BACL|nr:phosphotriesterase-related protein [Paludifilum halophilum]OYD06813.1 phosphotriesterase-related protein [Paludifilum halophilum]
MSQQIRTVTGDIPPDRFGPAMIHEHMVLDLSRIRGDRNAVLYDSAFLNRELNRLRKVGCGGIVEVTNRGMGREVRSLKTLSKRHGIPIVASTGYYKQTYYTEEVFQKSEEELSEIFISELTEGIRDTQIRAGIIAEIGSSLNEITEHEEKVFRAAIQGQKATGAPLSTHCELGTMGPAQLRLFTQTGANTAKISIGHQDLNGNREEHDALLRTGCYIQFDTIGKNHYRSDHDRIEDLLRLLDRGYGNQLMLSCDITKQSYWKVNGGFGYEYLFSTFLPELRRQGVSRKEIEAMMVHNPQRFLAFA